MRKALAQMASAALLCLLLAPVAGAHTSSPTLGGQRPDETATQPANAGQTVTIVGCLVQTNATEAGTERRSATNAGANDYFVRTPTVAVPAGTTITVGKPGTTDTTTSTGTSTNDSLYRITGLQREQLRPHVGHRVELQGHVTGNMASPGSGVGSAGTTAANATGSTARSGSRGGAGAAQRREQRGGQANESADIAGVLHATAIKMISASCP